VAEPNPIDARDGVSADVVEAFKRADRVVIGLKDRRTAVLLLARGDDQQYVIVPAMAHVTRGADLDREQPLVIRDAQHDLLWRNAIERLREGHVPVIEWSVGWAQVGVCLHTRRPPESQRATANEYRAKLVPLSTIDVWPGTGPTGTRQIRFALGPTTARRRMRVGEQYIVRGAPG
jgi:hypothetical protein